MTEIKECKESQEVIDFVVLKRAESSKNTNRVISWLLNDKGYKRYNGKEFKERDISTILLSQGVRRKSEYTKKKDNEGIEEENTIFKLGDKVRVNNLDSDFFNEIGVISGSNIINNEIVYINPDNSDIPSFSIDISSLELVKKDIEELLQSTSGYIASGDIPKGDRVYFDTENTVKSVKQEPVIFKEGDKVKIKTEYLSRYNQTGFIKEIYNEVIATIQFSDDSIDNINIAHLDLVKEEVKQEPERNTNQEFKIGDRVRVTSSLSMYFNQIGEIIGFREHEIARIDFSKPDYPRDQLVHIDNLELVEQDPVKEVETKPIINLKETMMKDLIIKEVAFNNVTMIGVQKPDGKMFVVLRRICEDLGIDFSSQLKRVKRDEDLKDDFESVVMMTTEGLRDSIILELNSLPTFLTGIQSNKCKEEVRPYLKEFKKKAKDILADAFLNKTPQPVILSPEEMFLVQAQNMVAMRKDVNQLKEVVQGLVANQEASRDQLKYLEVPKVLPLQKTERAQLNQLVRTYSQANSIPTQDSWNRLYSEFLYTYKINIKECASNRNIDNLDYVEKIAKIPELYSLAYKIFITDVLEIK